MKNIRITFFILFAVVLISSCEKEEIETETTSTLFPLDINNRWHYEERLFHKFNDVEIDTFIASVQHFHSIDGIEGYSSIDYQEGGPISLINNDKDGNTIEHFFDNNKLIHSTIFLKNEIIKNESWDYKSVVYQEDNTNFSIEEIEKKCIATDTIISTPAGEFNCVAFSYNRGEQDNTGKPNHTFIDFLAKNKGIIKRLHYEHDNNKTWLFREEILIEYSIME